MPLRATASPYHEVVWRAPILVILKILREGQHVPSLYEYAVHAERRPYRNPMRIVARPSGNQDMETTG